MKTRFFYGWVIAASSGIGIASSVMLFIPATIGILAAPLHKTFGWSLSQIMTALMVATTLTIVVAPFLGALVDRIGAIRVIVTSFIIEALLIASFHYLSGNIFWFYARYGALALLATGTTTVPFAKVISRWFDRRRGLALGLALAFTGIGGAVWSLGTQFLIVHAGLRNSFFWEAGFIAFIVIPILLITIRESPQSMGLNVDGAPDDTSVQRATAQLEKVGMNLREAAGTKAFWLIALVFFLVPFPIQGIMVNLVPMLISHGITAQIAASAQASLWIAMIVGRLSSGWLIDRFFGPRVAFGLLLPAVIGIAIFSAGVDGALAFLAAILVGVSNGSEGNILPYLTSRYFGLKHYTSIYGTFFSCFCLGSGLGAPVMAYMKESMGGYQQPLFVLGGVLVLGGLILLFYPPYPAKFKPVRFDAQPQEAAAQ